MPSAGFDFGRFSRVVNTLRQEKRRCTKLTAFATPQTTQYHT